MQAVEASVEQGPLNHVVGRLKAPAKHHVCLRVTISYRVTGWQDPTTVAQLDTEEGEGFVFSATVYALAANDVGWLTLSYR